VSGIMEAVLRRPLGRDGSGPAGYL
jgi:hypothetical protein